VTPIKIVLSAALFWLGSGATALAYLDPGSGSMFLQLLLGGVAGVVMLLKFYWHRLLVFFGINGIKKEETPSKTPGAPDAERPHRTRIVPRPAESRSSTAMAVSSGI